MTIAAIRVTNGLNADNSGSVVVDDIEDVMRRKGMSTVINSYSCYRRYQHEHNHLHDDSIIIIFSLANYHYHRRRHHHQHGKGADQYTTSEFQRMKHHQRIAVT